MNIREEIREHYREVAEEAKRLVAGQGELERLRTQGILRRFLPPAPAVVMDVGGAAGVYAIPLAAQGYSVHLIDPVDLHVSQARAAAESAGVTLASVTVGDARKLEFQDASADAVLMFGPMYHLVEQADRKQALREARRVLRPQGVLLAVGVSRFASLIDGAAQGFIADPIFRSIVAGDLASGRHENPGKHPHYFTTAYFHKPEELCDELQEAGFGGAQVLAVEGPVWSAAGFEAVWADPVQREALLGFLEKVEREPSVMGASAHFIAVGRRQG